MTTGVVVHGDTTLIVAEAPVRLLINCGECAPGLADIPPKVDVAGT